MNDLDQKLDKSVQSTIWIKPIDESQKEAVFPRWFVANGQTFTFGIDVAAIKQCFEEAGYIKIPPQVEDTWRTYEHMAGYKTGQEFYDRFTKEAEQPYRTVHIAESEHKQYLEAARRAAGLSNE